MKMDQLNIEDIDGKGLTDNNFYISTLIFRLSLSNLQSPNPQQRFGYASGLTQSD